MRTAFTYYGSKRRIASAIWQRFGDPSYYYEPFGGSLATILERPEATEKARYEYVNDADCLITNFFRAAKFGKPEELASLANWPASQLDLEARVDWLPKQRNRLHHNLTADPKWYDLDCAAWFAWVRSVKFSPDSRTLLVGRCSGVRRKHQNLTLYFTALARRLKDVSIHYGDWTTLANAAENQSLRNNCAILLDPPYKYATGRSRNLYATDSADVAEYVHRWALAIAEIRPKLRIALCGLVGEHKMPATWEEFPWSSGHGKGIERVWFSPNCDLKTNTEATMANTHDTCESPR